MNWKHQYVGYTLSQSLGTSWYNANLDSKDSRNLNHQIGAENVKKSVQSSEPVDSPSILYERQNVNFINVFVTNTICTWYYQTNSIF